MLKGDARVTVYSPDGSMFVDDVKEGASLGWDIGA